MVKNNRKDLIQVLTGKKEEGYVKKKKTKKHFNTGFQNQKKKKTNCRGELQRATEQERFF